MTLDEIQLVVIDMLIVTKLSKCTNVIVIEEIESIEAGDFSCDVISMVMFWYARCFLGYLSSFFLLYSREGTYCFRY